MTEEVLKRVPDEGSIWRHYKGGEYIVICTGWIEASTTPCVIYKPAEGGNIWVRPIKNFLSSASNDQWRFTRIG